MTNLTNVIKIRKQHLRPGDGVGRLCGGGDEPHEKVCRRPSRSENSITLHMNRFGMDLKCGGFTRQQVGDGGSTGCCSRG